MLRQNTRRAILLLSAVVSVKILILFVIVPGVKDLYPSVNVDTFPDHYEKLAQSLASGDGYRFTPDTAPTMSRTPGYPLLLAAVFALFGESLPAAKALNLGLVLATAWLVMDLARRLFAHPRPVILPALVILFHPVVILAETRGGPEILLAFTVTLFVALLHRALGRGRRWDHLPAGLALGAATLVKPTTLFFPVAWLAYPLLARRVRFRAHLANTTVMTLGLALLLAPWVIRNYAISGRFVPAMTVVGMSANQGLHICRNASLANPFKPGTHTGRGMNDGAYETIHLAREQGYSVEGSYFVFFHSSRDEVEFNRFMVRRVLDTYRRDPVLLIKCLIVNAFNFWFAGVTHLASIINFAVQAPLLILAAMGAVAGARRGRLGHLLPLLAFAAYDVAAHLPILAIARHSVPLIPLLGALAAGARNRRP